jgi:hypothetical protein
MPPTVNSAIPGLNAEQILWLCILVAAVGAGVVGAIVWFGRSIFYDSRSDFWRLNSNPGSWNQQGIHPNHLRYFLEALAESLQRRNEFWMTYGQVVISTLIIIILTILLLTKTISAEAGLPLLSAVSGFAIAKGVNSSRSAAPESEQPDPEPKK